jgi:hypothetical protein
MGARMIVAIQATRGFSDYSVFLKGVGHAIHQIEKDDKEIFIYSAGPVNLNSMGMEFTNVSERGFKGRGIKIKFYKVPPSWIDENIYKIDHFVFFANKKEPLSPQVEKADAKDANVWVHRY